MTLAGESERLAIKALGDERRMEVEMMFSDFLLKVGLEKVVRRWIEGVLRAT